MKKITVFNGHLKFVLEGMRIAKKNECNYKDSVQHFKFLYRKANATGISPSLSSYYAIREMGLLKK